MKNLVNDLGLSADSRCYRERLSIVILSAIAVIKLSIVDVVVYQQILQSECVVDRLHHSFPSDFSFCSSSLLVNGVVNGETLQYVNRGYSSMA